MYDVISIGSATRDVFVKSDLTKIVRIRDVLGDKEFLAFDYGAKINVNSIFMATGGGGTNSATSFARNGLNTAVLTTIGDDSTGREILDALASENLDTSLVVTVKGKQTGYSVVINSFEGDRTILTCRGANHHLTPDRIDWDALTRTKWVYLTSLTGESESLIGPIADFIEGHGVSLAFNPGGAQIRRGLDSLASIFATAEVLIVNKDEASQLAGVPVRRRWVDEQLCTLCEACVNVCGQGVFKIRDEKIVVSREERCDRCGRCVTACPTQAITIEPWAHDQDELLKALHSTGAKIVVITDGARGTQAYDGKTRYLCPPVQVDAVDTLGAGDAFGSTFVAYLEKTGGDIESALKHAAGNAASVVTKLGAKPGLLREDELEEFLASHAGDALRVRKKKM